MAEITVTVADMRAAFPEFGSETQYPDAFLQRFLTEATCFISTRNYRLRPQVRILAIEYMAAHLMTLSAVNGDGTPNASFSDAGGAVTSAHIDGVSVSMQAPIASDAFAQWIQTTPYGKALWALLTANNPVGVFWCGNPKAWGIR